MYHILLFGEVVMIGQDWVNSELHIDWGHNHSPFQCSQSDNTMGSHLLLFLNMTHLLPIGSILVLLRMVPVSAS